MHVEVLHTLRWKHFLVPLWAVTDTICIILNCVIYRPANVVLDESHRPQSNKIPSYIKIAIKSFKIIRCYFLTQLAEKQVKILKGNNVKQTARAHTRIHWAIQTVFYIYVNCGSKMIPYHNKILPSLGYRNHLHATLKILKITTSKANFAQ